MENNRFSELTVSQINTFLSVGRTLSMSASAQELFLSQSTVSKRINEIEKITGIELFLRKNNSLSLTDAGRFFYNELSDIYDKLCVSIYDANAIQNGYLDNFSMIVDTSVNVREVFNALKMLGEKYPKLNITVETDVYNQKQKILNKEADIAMSYMEPFGTFEDRLEYRPIKETPLYAVVNKNSPLAQKEKIGLSDLVNENIIVPAEQIHEGYVNNLEYFFRNFRQVPNILGIIHSFHLEYQAILNKGVVITTMESIKQNNEDIVHYFSENLKFYPLDEAPIVSAFCWGKNNSSKYIKEFLDLFESVNA